jgi:Arm DNA-binding domain
MLFQDLKSKASKRSVQIKTSNGRLQLVCTYVDKRHYLSLGFSDTKTHRKLAEAKARQLELDMLSGHSEADLLAPCGNGKADRSSLALETDMAIESQSRRNTRGFQPSRTE